MAGPVLVLALVSDFAVGSIQGHCVLGLKKWIRFLDSTMEITLED